MKLWPMAAVEGGETIAYVFECPGCGCHHAPSVRPPSPVWTFNGDMEKPTFSPSILYRWTEGENHVKKVCHSFIRDGRIQFLGDCTHALAGQTVALPDVE